MRSRSVQASLWGPDPEDVKDQPKAEKSFIQEIQELAQDLRPLQAEMPEWFLVRHTINGNIPSKSNCYEIITFKPKKGSGKKGHSSLKKSDKLLDYEKTFADQWRRVTQVPIKGHFRLVVDVYFRWMRADLDNSLKILLDCLQTSGSIENDNLCMEINARKHVDKDNPRIEFSLKKLHLHETPLRNEKRGQLQDIVCRPCRTFNVYPTDH